MKVFISQPMNGRTSAEIVRERKDIIAEIKMEYGHETDIVDSYFEDAPADAKPLWFLGKSLERLSEADKVFFAPGWAKARGCKIEHDAAMAYGIDIICD